MQPGVANGASGGLGQIPVALDDLRGTYHDLADLTSWQLIVVRIDDFDLHNADRLTTRAHARAAGRIMILGRQVRDDTGGLGQAVHLTKPAFERRDSLAQ